MNDTRKTNFNSKLTFGVKQNRNDQKVAVKRKIEKSMKAKRQIESDNHLRAARNTCHPRLSKPIRGYRLRFGSLKKGLNVTKLRTQVQHALKTLF